MHVEVLRLQCNRLAQFDEDAVGRLGMQKNDPLVVGAAFGFAVQRNEAFSFEAFEFSVDVVYFKSDVVYAFAALVDVLGDGTFGIGCFQQFEFAFTDVKKRSGHMLTVHRFHLVMGFSEQFTDQFIAFGHVFDGDANVVDAAHSGLFLFDPNVALSGQFLQIKYLLLHLSDFFVRKLYAYLKTVFLRIVHIVAIFKELGF